MRKKILVYSKTEDLKKMAKKIDSNEITTKDLFKIKKLLKLFIETDHLIIDDSFSGEILALFFKVIKNKSYDLWLDEFRHYPIYQRVLHHIAMNSSKNIFTRSKQIRFYLNQLYKKPTFVIYPWVEEINYKKREIKYNIYIRSNKEIILPQKWNRVKKIEDADISILEFEKNILKVSMPKIIFQSISLRIPTIIVYDNIKLVNKLFKAVHNIYPTREINFHELEILMYKNYSFKVPKKYRFNYNLANLKKRIIK